MFDRPGGQIYSIEANPRTSTNLMAFYNHPEFARALFEPQQVLKESRAPLLPLSTSLPSYWIWNEVGKVLLGEVRFGSLRLQSPLQRDLMRFILLDLISLNLCRKLVLLDDLAVYASADVALVAHASKSRSHMDGDVSASNHSSGMDFAVSAGFPLYAGPQSKRDFPAAIKAAKPVEDAEGRKRCSF